MALRCPFISLRCSSVGLHVNQFQIVINPKIIYNATTTIYNASITHESVVRILIIHAAIHTHEVSTIRLNLSELHVSVVSVDTNVSNCLDVPNALSKRARIISVLISCSEAEFSCLRADGV